VTIEAVPIPLTLLFLAALLGWMARARLSARGLLMMRIGVVLSVLGAAGNYVEYGDLRYGRFVNPHDVYHYYIGAKYSPEHRYADLYRATLLAQDEAEVGRVPTRIRDLDTHERETYVQVVAKKAAVKGRFSEERWADLQRDVAVFYGLVPPSKWARMLGDKGYNPTPVWNLLGRAIAEAVPIDNGWGLHVLTSFDLLLIGLMGTVAGLALGWEAGLLLVAFIGLNVFGSFVHIKGAFLRLDWLAALVGAVLCLRSKKGVLAGVLVAYAAMVRVFPAVFVGGPLLLLGEHLLRRRKVPVELKHFVVGTAAGVAGLFLLTLPFGGWSLWAAFVHKMGVHAGDLSSNRMGLLYALLDHVRPRKALAATETLKLWVAAPAMLVWAASVRRLAPAGALAWGVVPVFLLAEATFYYYVMLTVPVVWLLSRRGDRPGDGAWQAVAVALLGTSVLGYARALSIGHDFLYFRELSVAVGLLYVVFALAALPGLQGAPSPLSWLWQVGRRRPRVVGGIGALAVGVLALVWAGPSTWVALHQPLADLRANDDERELVFVGDVMLSRNVATSLERSRRSPDYLFEQTAHLIQDADLSFANLECPVSGRSEAIDKKYVFNADPNVIPALEAAGFDLVSLANNHTLDYGTLALDDTVMHLDASPIEHVGLSHGDEPQSPHIVDLDGIKVGTLAYCDPVPGYSCAKEFDAFPHGPAKASTAVVKRDIQALRPLVDIVVVSMHWGKEYRLEPGGRQKGFARFVLRQGADIIAGHHPHVQQDAAWVDDGLVIYSMGNFVFDQRKPNTQDSRLYRVVVGKEGVRRASFLPLEIPTNLWQPRPVAEHFVPVPSLERLLRTELDWW